MPRCAIYARFSTDRQNPHSAEDQVAICSAYAEREGWEVADVFTDIALSGTNNRRPGMTGMLSAAAAGAFDIVLGEALDRFARNQADIATIYQRLEFAGVKLHTLSEGHVNEMHIGFRGTMSSMFLKDLADKIRRGQRGTVVRGRVPGGLAYGYDVVSRIGADGELERGLRAVNATQAAIIQRIYREYVAGVSPKRIAHTLNAEGIPSPRGGEWSPSAINGSRARRIGILRNPIYAGRYLYNRVQMKRDPESRKRVSRINAAEDMVTVDMPELRIVDEELWQAAQDAAEARTMLPLGDRNRPRHLLSGLITCGTCGGSMIVIGGGRVGCTRHREKGTCDVGRTIQRAELEKRVLSGIVDQLLEPQAVSRLVKRYHDEMEAHRADRSQGLAEIERRITKADTAVQRLVAAIADGAADFAEIHEALSARKADREALRRERDEIAAVPVLALNPQIVEAYRKLSLIHI